MLGTIGWDRLDEYLERSAAFVERTGPAIEVTVTGTHLGDWRGLPAMGRRMESRLCVLYSFDDKGMLALERAYYDKAKILEQLGIFADPRTTTGKVMAAITPPFAVVRKLGERFFQRLKNRG